MKDVMLRSLLLWTGIFYLIAFSMVTGDAQSALENSRNQEEAPAKLYFKSYINVRVISQFVSASYSLLSLSPSRTLNKVSEYHRQVTKKAPKLKPTKQQNKSKNNSKLNQIKHLTQHTCVLICVFNI